MTCDLIEIRRGIPADAARLAEFGRRTYEDAFGPDNDPQNLALYLAAAYGEERQRGELASPDVITLLAEQGERLVGFAQVRRGSPPACVSGEGVVELWRFYVDRRWHGQGVAQQIMAAALDAALEMGGQRIWLSAWEKNPRAISFYTRSGFVDVGTTDFWVGHDRQTDRVMVREL